MLISSELEHARDQEQNGSDCTPLSTDVDMIALAMIGQAFGRLRVEAANITESRPRPEDVRFEHTLKWLTKNPDLFLNRDDLNWVGEEFPRVADPVDNGCASLLWEVSAYRYWRAKGDIIRTARLLEAMTFFSVSFGLYVRPRPKKRVSQMTHDDMTHEERIGIFDLWLRSNNKDSLVVGSHQPNPRTREGGSSKQRIAHTAGRPKPPANTEIRARFGSVGRGGIRGNDLDTNLA